MRTHSRGIVPGIGVMVLMSVSLAPAVAQTEAAKIVGAANSFLATLDAQQKTKVMYAFDDEKQRKTWSNFPVVMVPRGGIPLKDMNAAQQKATMALVATALSPRGYEKVLQIMDGDEVNKTTDQGPGGGRGNGGPRNGPPPGGGPPPGMGPGGPRPGGRGMGGGGSTFGKDLYYVSILGIPSEKTPWMLQFGGHHLALNITIDGARGVLTPSLTGAQPALYTLNGKTVRPLGQESDKAFALLQTLDEKQKAKAILSYRLADLVLGPGQDGKVIAPEGLKGTEMTEKQKAILLDVMSEWANIVHEDAAKARMAQLKADLNETYFAWSGPVTVMPGSNITAYYRIQGPHVVIEYAPQGLGGDPALHVHAMYRDPTNDYGRKTVAAK
jgi:Protein of unknown function (DUF3500)